MPVTIKVGRRRPWVEGAPPALRDKGRWGIGGDNLESRCVQPRRPTLAPDEELIFFSAPPPATGAPPTGAPPERSTVPRMIEPYQAIGLVPTMWGIRRREEIAKTLEHLEHLFKAAFWLGGLDQPVRLVAIPEGTLQGVTDEGMDLDQQTYARECAIDIPGPETERIGALARQWDVYVMAQAKARHPEFPGRFFNVGFVVSPAGEVILRHHKLVPLLPVEHSVTPHNVWDRWIELYGASLDSFYPVVDTEIGKLGIMMANEGSYPENARGLAMNGAEIAYRGPYPAPGVMSGMFSVQNRARALDNNMYVIGMNLGTYLLDKDSTT